MVTKYSFATEKLFIVGEKVLDSKSGTLSFADALLAEGIATGAKAFIKGEVLEKTMFANIRTVLSMTAGAYPKCFITAEITEKTMLSALAAYVNAISA